MLSNISWSGKFDFHGSLGGELVEVVLLKVVTEAKLIDWFSPAIWEELYSTTTTLTGLIKELRA